MSKEQEQQDMVDILANKMTKDLEEAIDYFAQAYYGIQFWDVDGPRDIWTAKEQLQQALYKNKHLDTEVIEDFISDCCDEHYYNEYLRELIILNVRSFIEHNNKYDYEDILQYDVSMNI